MFMRTDLLHTSFSWTYCGWFSAAIILAFGRWRCPTGAVDALSCFSFPFLVSFSSLLSEARSLGSACQFVVAFSAPYPPRFAMERLAGCASLWRDAAFPAYSRGGDASTAAQLDELLNRAGVPGSHR